MDFAKDRGASFRSLARDAECTVRFLIDCYEGRRNVPSWLFLALPRDAHAEAVRLEIESLRKVG